MRKRSNFHPEILGAGDELDAGTEQAPPAGIDEDNGPTFCYTSYIRLFFARNNMYFDIFLTLWARGIVFLALV